MKNLIIILTLFLFTPLLFGQSKENCYVVVESSKEFNSTFLSNISASIIPQFLREVEPIPPEGISRESCFYQISVSKQQDTTFVTFKGKNLNSYGDSKLSGTDEFNSLSSNHFLGHSQIKDTLFVKVMVSCWNNVKILKLRQIKLRFTP